MGELDGAITEYGAESAELIRLLLLTGFRREWMRARKANFDMRHAIWTKPSHAVKENKTERVPLGRATMAVLRRVMEAAKDSDTYSRARTRRSAGRRSEGRGSRYCARPGLMKECAVTDKDGQPVMGEDGEPLKRWKPKVRLHDLRHSYISWLAENGAPLTTIGKLVGHQRVETPERYSHVEDKSLREAADAVLRRHGLDHYSPVRELLNTGARVAGDHEFSVLAPDEHGDWVPLDHRLEELKAAPATQACFPIHRGFRATTWRS